MSINSPKVTILVIQKNIFETNVGIKTADVIPARKLVILLRFVKLDEQKYHLRTLMRLLMWLLPIMVVVFDVFFENLFFENMFLENMFF